MDFQKVVEDPSPGGLKRMDWRERMRRTTLKSKPSEPKAAQHAQKAVEVVLRLNNPASFAPSHAHDDRACVQGQDSGHLASCSSCLKRFVQTWYHGTLHVRSQVKDLEVVMDRDASPVATDDPYMAMIRPMLSGEC
eukprot:scaffold99368_cov19-Tisochrysis_lutea.AAC.1